MNEAVQLAAGLSARPLGVSDAAAVTALIAAEEQTDVGEVLVDEADIVSDWQRPSFELASGTIGVFEGADLVAYAEFSGGDRGDAAVHPDHRGKGIGTALAHWMQGRARAAGSALVGVSVVAGSPGDVLLRGLGYTARWTAWDLRLPPGREISSPPLPAGYTLRAASEAEYRQVWTVVEDAFLEWADRQRESFADFSSRVFARPGFEPWNVRVALDQSGAVVGAVHVVLSSATAYLPKLAVRHDHRGRGLARALLTDAFAVARERGGTVCELSTDTRTGALGLYEKVGMEVASTWINYAIPC